MKEKIELMNQKKFESYLKDAEKTITIIGTNSLVPILENSGSYFADLLTVHKKLTITILFESDNENFNQSLCLNFKESKNRQSYEKLNSHRDRIKGRNENSGLKFQILKNIDEKKRLQIANRVYVLQNFL